MTDDRRWLPPDDTPVTREALALDAEGNVLAHLPVALTGSITFDDVDVARRVTAIRWVDHDGETHETPVSIRLPDDIPSITCPRCGRTSWNPNDVREGYCGACHDWTGQP